MLRGHVRRGADDPTATAVLSALTRLDRGDDGLAHAARMQGGAGPRDAPVHHVDLAELADHEVEGRQVAVHHAPRVGEGDRVAGPDQDLEQPDQRARLERPAGQGLDVVAQGLPLDELHCEMEPSVRLDPHVVDGDDVGMVELGRDLGLTDEGGNPSRQSIGVGVQDLEGGTAPQGVVDDGEHRPHAAASHLAEHP